MNNVIRLPERPRMLSVDAGTAYLIEQLQALRNLTHDLGYIEAGHFVSVALKAVELQATGRSEP